VIEYRLRDGSGGTGIHNGGDGLVRTIEFLAPVSVTLVSKRKKRPPYAQKGGRADAGGRNSLIRGDEIDELPGKFTLGLKIGDKLRIETPGGGGWGSR
jgi:N-methylhydantoinase B